MSSLWSYLIVTCHVAQTLNSNKIQFPPNAIQINRNTFVDDIGVLFLSDDDILNEAHLNTSRRRLVDDASCATPPYRSSCTSTNPDCCPCTALTQSEKQQLLDTHNTRRNLAASGEELCSSSDGSSTVTCPSASNMNHLFWDHGLEKVATYWAHQCVWGHHQNEIAGEQSTMYQQQCDSNNCLAKHYNGQWIGENLAASGHSNPSWTLEPAIGGITRWFDESKLYHFDTRSTFGTTGHWTQGAWASTRYVGCGYAACSTGTPFGGITEWFNFVCKYFPGGNYGGQDPYIAGNACDECGKDRTCSDGIICGGDQCSACAVDYGQSQCNYTEGSCPSKMLSSDGVSTTSAVTCNEELWDNKSEQALISGVVGSFVTLVVLLVVLGFVIYAGIIKKDEAMYDGSEDKKLFALILSALVLFVLPLISFAFIKDNVVMGDEYDPYESCKMGWFLEYFGYEIGKLLIACFLICRFYTGFNDGVLTKTHMMHIFGKFLPGLCLMYFILILMGFLLKDQFSIIVSYTKFHLYCGYEGVSAVFVMANIISFIREIGFGAIVLYLYGLRVCGKEQKHVQNADQTEEEPKELKIEKKSKKKTGTNDGDHDEIWEKYITKQGKEPKTCNELHAFSKSDTVSQLTYKEAKEIFDRNKGIASDKKTPSKETKKKANKTKTKKKINKTKNKKDDAKKAILVKYMIVIVIMFLSSFISQILLCSLKYPSFYISWDIIIQCIGCVLFLWISHSIWTKLIQIFHQICLCDHCCPVLVKQTHF